MNDYEQALAYLKICFEQCTRDSCNENVYADDFSYISVSEIEDFLKTI